MPVLTAQTMWKFDGTARPPFAVEPAPGQESVWDYPRPPAIVLDRRRVVVSDGGHVIADSENSLRILETASPPTFYLPPHAVEWTLLVPAAGQSCCEWKGTARYWALREDPQRGAVGWSYDAPSEGFAAIAGHLAVYPGRLSCFLAGERVRAQAEGFYGGWITNELVGPFKGDAGSAGW